MKHFKIMRGCRFNSWRVDFPKLAALCPGEPFTVYSLYSIAYHYNESGEFISREGCPAPDDAIPVFELPVVPAT